MFHQCYNQQASSYYPSFSLLDIWLEMWYIFFYLQFQGFINSYERTYCRRMDPNFWQPDAEEHDNLIKIATIPGPPRSWH